MSGLFKARYTLSRSQVLERTWPFVLDLGVAAGLLACFYAVLLIARYWMSGAVPEVVISLRPGILPVYAFYSVVRIGVAYLLSLLFAVGYGYVAAYNPRVEALMIATLDILQSIPVLSFLPALMLAMMALVPSRQLGIEMGAILLIFTGQVWNLAFSFYTSLKTIPREMIETSLIYRYSRWQRFWQLQMPFAAIGLIWNSIISVAGGWFALIACEMFTMGNKNFQLPGLGSYLKTAAEAGDTRAQLFGFLVVILIVIATDQLIWRPLIAWSDKFKFEQVESADRVTSPILALLQRSNLFSELPGKLWSRIEEPIYREMASTRECRIVRPIDEVKGGSRWSAVFWTVLVVCGAVALWGAARAIAMLHALHWMELKLLLEGALATFLRVNLSILIAILWTVPVGVAIGFNPRLSRFVQPVAQVLASIPATAFFPFIVGALLYAGIGLGPASIALMLLGMQWYILFNVIAGAMSIPSDLREVASLYRFTRMQRWTKLILPGIFPFLITGVITASGGAWNASVFAEYTQLKDRTLQINGLGSTIQVATDQNNFPVLLLATMLISIIVVSMNRLVWRRLYNLAETRFKLEA